MESVQLACPSEPLKSGQTLIVLKPFMTLGNRLYQHGDELRLIERTEEAPYGYKSSLGNWVVQCPHTTSVWSNIEAMVQEGGLGQYDTICG